MKFKYDTSSLAGKIGVMAYYHSTKERIFKRNKNASFGHVPVLDLPGWDWVNFDYNYPAEPEQPKLAPWTLETVPKGRVWMRISDNQIALVTAFDNDSIHIGTYGWKGYSGILNDGWIHSIDDGKTWNLCGVVE